MTARGKGARLAIATGIILFLLLLATPLVAQARAASAQKVTIVPTTVCSCSEVTAATMPGTTPFRGDQPAPLYDEQVGETFTQSFTSLEYNVTAVEQTDPTTQDGPVYLVNGLSSSGYWYQVGISWNWSPGTNPGTGFDLNYEVFNPSGNSVFPSGDQGGLQAFSGPVHDGDTIVLNLYFDTSSRTVVMLGEDADTGASSSVSFSSEGADDFVGLPGSVANINGFFTGLMTEWYHGVPYYADEAEVIYSDPQVALSSGWMWTDEFNVNTFQSLFSATSPSAITFSPPTSLQEFSYNGTTAYGDAYQFITGALNSTTTSSVVLTLSYSVEGGGAGYSAPVLEYTSGGTAHNTSLTQTPAAYDLDLGTNWSVSQSLGGSNSSERWGTDQVTAGVANASETIQFVYQHQWYVNFGFSVSGGGTGYSVPEVTYSSFGTEASTPANGSVWADAGSAYSYTDPLQGSNASVRWLAAANGTVGSAGAVSVTYYRQYLVTFDLTFKDTNIFPGISLKSTSAGLPFSATIIVGTNTEWLDAGASYSAASTYSLASGERLVSMGNSNGTVTPNLVVPLVYQEQFYVSVAQNTPSGGTVTPQSGWYDSGSTIDLQANAAQGWRFESWEGAGSDSASGNASSLSLTVGPATAANETATFYPGVEIHADGPVSVSYADGSIKGTVSGGASADVFVPPSSELVLSASSPGLLTTFSGWSGASNSSAGSVTLTVGAPLSITSDSSYNYGVLGILGVVVLVIILGALLAVRRGRRSVKAQALPG